MNLLRFLTFKRYGRVTIATACLGLLFIWLASGKRMPSNFLNDVVMGYFPKQNLQKDPLFRYIDFDRCTLNLMELPRRTFGTYFRSYTTSNPNNTVLKRAKNPDMDLFLEQVNETGAVIFRHTGAGCVQQIFVVGEGFKDNNVTNHKIKLEIIMDGQSAVYTLHDIMKRTQWPFIKPINKDDNGHIDSGIGSMLPFCFRHNAEIRYYYEAYPNLVQRGVDCAIFVPCLAGQSCAYFGPRCPFRLNVDIAMLEFPSSEATTSFGDYIQTPSLLAQHKSMLETTSTVLRHPRVNAELTSCPKSHCYTHSNSSLTHEVFKATTPGLITLWEISTNVTSFNDFFVTATYDGKTTIASLRLSSLFKVSAPQHQAYFTSALHSFGNNMKCSSTGIHLARFLFPMPFLKSASISITSLQYTGNAQAAQLCHNFIVENHSSTEELGLFHAQELFYSHSLFKWEAAIDIADTWGHLVDLFVRIDNFNTSETIGIALEMYGKTVTQYPMVEADIFGYIDGQFSPAVTSTGLEDFFSMGHSFRGMWNRAVTFFGVPYSQPITQPGASMHFFRTLFSDPIIFQNSLLLMLESYHDYGVTRANTIDYASYIVEKTAKRPTISFYTAYYGAKEKSKMIGLLAFSPNDGNLYCDGEKKPTKTRTETTDYIFNYVSDAFTELIEYHPIGANCQFKIQQQVKHLSTSQQSKFILRRDHYLEPWKWSEAVRLIINGVEVGVYNSYLGSLRRDQARREVDLAFTLDQSVSSISVVLHYLSDANDVKYTLYTVM